MGSSMTRGLVVGATLLGGMLAGVAADRTLIQLPAWRHVGTDAWISFTREADLDRGLILYPAQGLSALVLSVAAAVAFYFDQVSPRSAGAPIYGAALLAIFALLVTRFMLAPDMLSLRHIGNDATVTQAVFSRIESWWAVKAALHVLTFAANVWALTVLSSGGLF